MRTAQRPPLQHGVQGWRRAKCAGAADPPNTLWVTIAQIWYRLGKKNQGQAAIE